MNDPAALRSLEALRSGDPAGALLALSNVAGDQSSGEVHFVRALALARLARYGESLRSARECLEKNLGFAPALELIDRIEDLLAAEPAPSLPEAHANEAAGAAPSEWRIGDVVEHRWKIFGSAQGGMGRVYFVRDRDWDGMELAVKTLLLPQGLSESEADISRRMFRRETQVWLDLGSHPNIVSGFYTLE
ncbi:MAG: hypothetical protein ABIT01_08405, partial [Thermoanaerobaculia bacterium]